VVHVIADIWCMVIVIAITNVLGVEMGWAPEVRQPDKTLVTVQ
jgi:hypothetical protein